MAIDLPANFQETAYGAPVVQVAQAASSSAGCQQTGTQRYKLGNSGDTLDITRNAEGKPTSFILTKSDVPTELKVKVMVPTPQLIVVNFADRSSITLFSMNSPDGRAIPSNYKDASGQKHNLIPVSSAAAGAKPQCTMS